MRPLYFRWLVRFFVFMLPYTVLAVLGIFWLSEKKLAVPFAVVVAVMSLIGWLLVRWMDSRPVKLPETPPPSGTWPPAGDEAWARVDAIAQRVQLTPPPINNSEAWQDLAWEVLVESSTPFNPNASNPAAAVSLPDALKLAEIIVRDLRDYIDENVPFSDRIRFNAVAWVFARKKQLAGATPWSTLFQRARTAVNAVVWGGRLVTSPKTAVISGTRQALMGSAASAFTVPLAGGVAAHFVRTLGRYSIDLYSGQLDLGENHVLAAHSKPLQVLLLGQTKAGKSSLVNALFGQARAATDILPCTREITPFVVQKEGLDALHLFDTVGFGGNDDKQAIKLLNNKLADCDLILVACSATSAAREADRKLVDEARQKLAAMSTRALPPIVVALTHVDTIRPVNEWNPPYDFAAGEAAKERNVRQACQAVARDLQVNVDEVVPVCTHPSRVYNVDEGLMASILKVLPEADQAKVLRVLEENLSAAEWEKRKRRLINLGFATAEMLVKSAPVINALSSLSVGQVAKQLLTSQRSPEKEPSSQCADS